MVWRRAARLGSWDEPLNFDLHLTLDGEPRIPFDIYVQSKPTTERQARLQSNCTKACTSFPQFGLLPAELRQYIVSFCDGPTLFQLMQVSPTRHEAKKLFWSDPDTWYCVDGPWIRHGAYPGTTDQDLDFLAHVQHVNVDYDFLQPWQWTESPNQSGLNDGLHVDESCYADKIHEFWQRLQRVCPHLTHVLFSTQSAPEDPWDTPQAFLEIFIRLCPADINASVSLRQEQCHPDGPNYEPRMERSLWHLASGNNRLEKLVTDWIPRIVLPPPKTFQGPVGALSRSLYRFHRAFTQRTAAEILLIDAIERHHFHKRHVPFVCFAPDCQVWFQAPGEYLLHVVETGHDESATPPAEWEALFEEHSQRLDRYEQDSYEPFDLDTKECDRVPWASHDPYDEDQAMIRIMEDEVFYYGECFERRALLLQREYDARRTFRHQLEHDPLYATDEPAHRHGLSCLWEEHADFVRGDVG